VSARAKHGTHVNLVIVVMTGDILAEGRASATSLPIFGIPILTVCQRCCHVLSSSSEFTTPAYATHARGLFGQPEGH
jgi:hypothetical protein